MLDATISATIRFRLLGEATLAAGNGEPFRLSTQKGMALLAYLAMTPGRAIGRSVLADLLWSDRTDSQARQNLRQTLLSLRRDLGPGLAHALLADDQSLMLRPEAVEVDALAFVARANAADPALREQSLDLPWGAFLDNFSTGAEVFDQWVLSERQRLDAIAIRTFAELAERFDVAGDGERAILALERLIAIDPSEEERHRRLISLEARYRGPDAALARAKSLAALLTRELDAEPEPATLALVEEIRASATTRLRPEDIKQRATHLQGDGTEAATTATVSAPEAKLPVYSRSPRRYLAVAAVILAGIAIGSLYVLLPTNRGVTESQSAAAAPSWQSPRLPSQPADSLGRQDGVVAIAVLPFANNGEASESANVLAEMVTDDLTSTLSHIGEFRVISRQTAKTYRGQVDPAAVGAELGVRYLVEGSMAMRQNRVLINVELIETKSRSRIWAGRFERTNTNRHTVADEIVYSLGRELQVEVTQLEGGRDSKDPNAHELVFKGNAALFDAAKSGVEALRQAERYFVQALERDPDNPRAQIGLAGYHVNMVAQLFAPDAAQHQMTAATILQHVIEQHPNIDAAHNYMGLLQLTRGRVDDAILSFERSIEINPSHAVSHAQLGRALLRKGRPSEGLEHIHYAMRLSPRDPALSYWLGYAGSGELELQNYGKAIEYLDRALMLNPGQPRTALVLVAAHAQAGNLEEAGRQFEQLRKTQPHLSPDTLLERFFGPEAKTRDSQLRQGFQRVLASLRDPWQPPAVASTLAMADGRGNGIVALAVLPFASYGEAGEPSRFADMMTDDLTNVLSRVPGIRVISRNTSETYRNQRIDAAAIGTELGVHYLLEGRVSMRENEMRVNVELTDTKTRLHVWTGRFDLTGNERHRVQKEIVNSLGRELQVEVAQIEDEKGDQESDVHALIIKGWGANYNVAASGPAGLQDAERYFTQALERDPNASRAVVGLAAHYIQVVDYGLAPDPAAYLAKAETMLKEEIEHRSFPGGAHYYLGAIYRMRGQWEDAIKVLERGLLLNPSHAPSYAAMGLSLVRLGRAEEGLEDIRYAMRLSPKDHLIAYWLTYEGAAELELGQFDKAIEHLTDARARNPRYALTLTTLAAAHAVTGDLTQARGILEELSKLSPQLSRERLLARYGSDGRASNLRRGLRLAMDLTPDP
jgi:TolB-like protein/DNA-binding SARP family transcriptional activator/Tfp pilus assembly protein PilF